MKTSLILALTLALIAVLTLNAHAEDAVSLPDAPSTSIHAVISQSSMTAPQRAYSATETSFSRKIYYSELAVFAITDIADGLSTARDSRWGYAEETSYEFGTHPTAARYFITSGIIDGAQCFAAWKLEHSDRKFFRMAGHAIMLSGAGIHARSFGLNVSRIHGRVSNQ